MAPWKGRPLAGDPKTAPPAADGELVSLGVGETKPLRLRTTGSVAEALGHHTGVETGE